MLSRLAKSLDVLLRLAGVAALVALPFVLRGATVGSLTSFTNGSLASAAQVNANFQALATAVNGTDDLVQKLACEARRGVWTGGACREFAQYGTDACPYGACTCPATHHRCTFPDLFSGGFASLRRPGHDLPATAGYAWVGGTYPDAQNTFFYPWPHGGSPLTCSAGAHYMIDMRRNAAGSTAWGCYTDSYTSATVLCCRNDQ